MGCRSDYLEQTGLEAGFQEADQVRIAEERRAALQSSARAKLTEEERAALGL